MGPMNEALTPEQARAQLLAFLREARPPLAAVREDARSVELLEPSSGQALELRWEEIAQLERRTSPLRPRPYLALALGDGRQLALADVGFAFAPSLRNSGPLSELPPTVCFGDLSKLLAGFDVLVREAGREGEATHAFLAAIAIVDGARDAGFGVGREERALEERLRRLEGKTPPGPKR
jgi:hypothetical protein